MIKGIIWRYKMKNKSGFKNGIFKILLEEFKPLKFWPDFIYTQINDLARLVCGWLQLLEKKRVRINYLVKIINKSIKKCLYS